jgi:hypothetical protein
MIKSHRLDQRDVFGVGPVLEVLLRVPALVVNLREPFTGVDAASQPRNP